MEPKSPIPRFENEIPAVSHESTGEMMTPVHEQERSPERTHEQVERRADATLGAAQAMPVLPVPVPPVVMTTPQPVDAGAVVAPAAAADEDLIEKEWVDRAKQIIEQTKDDPFRREQEVNKLQADYLRKRYGRELGAPQ